MKPNPANQVEMSQHLAHLSALCDSGFALAIHIRLTRPSLLYQTYAPEWIDFYTEQGFMLSDPVVHWGLSNMGFVDWADLADHDPAGVLTAAKAHGLQNGVTFATGTATNRTIAGLTRSSAPFTLAERAEIARIIDAVHQLLEGFEALPPAEQDDLRGLLE